MSQFSYPFTAEMAPRKCNINVCEDDEIRETRYINKPLLCIFCNGRDGAGYQAQSVLQSRCFGFCAMGQKVFGPIISAFKVHTQ